MPKLLLLSAGTNACYHIARTIKKFFHHDFKIIGADINDEWMVPTFPYIDSFYKVPYSSNNKYYDIIIDICANEGVEFIIPSFDMDQSLFYPENEKLHELGIVSFGTNMESLKYYKNKLKMNQFLSENDFVVPKSYNAQECIPDTQYMVKPINGFGSIGAGIKKGYEIQNVLQKEYVIQECCFDPEVTMECFFYKGHFSSVCRERIATKAGVCTKAKVYKDVELEKIGRRFAETLKVPIFFNLQFMKNANGEYAITDVNLRAAGGMSLSYAAGWDEVSALAKIMLNRNINDIFSTLPDSIDTTYVVRAYTDIVTKILKKVVVFDLDGTLLDSRDRHKKLLSDILRSHGIYIDISDLIEFKRNGYNNIKWMINKGINRVFAEKYQQEWIEQIETEKYLAMDILYPNTYELLEEYAEYDKILVTARSNEQAVLQQIKKLGLDMQFKKVFVVSPFGNVPQQKASILKKMNASIMIGDTKSDAFAAKLAGISFRHLNHGFHSSYFVEE